MNRFDFFKDWYQREDERLSDLNNSLNIPIGILTGLFAIIFFLIKEFNLQEENYWILLSFFFLIISSIIFWIIVIFHLFKSYNKLFKGYEYEAFPFPSQLNNQYEELKKWHDENKEELDQEDTVESIYQNQLIEMISGYLEVNITNNDSKSKHLFIAKKFLLITIILISISVIPYSLNKILTKAPDKIQKIEIQNLSEIFQNVTSKMEKEESKTSKKEGLKDSIGNSSLICLPDSIRGIK